MISPASVVVVVLPFDPVMATIGPGRNCAASSISPITVSPKRTRLHQRRRIDRNARADHDQVLSAKGALAVAAGFDRDAMVEQHRDFVAQFVAALGVGDGDLAPHAPSETEPRPRRTCRGRRPARVFVQFHRDPFHHRVTETQRNQLLSPRSTLILTINSNESQCLRVIVTIVASSYRSFSVVSANSAKTSDAIQKRTMIFDSDQPSSSK